MAKNQVTAHHERGRILTILESLLTQPTRTGELVISGDPVFVGSIVGVALIDAGASTDLVTVDTEGVFDLAVVAKNGNGTNDAVAIGDLIYIDSAAVLNKGVDGIPFGYARGAVTAGSTTTIGVKLISQRRGEKFYIPIGSWAAGDEAKGYFIAPAPCSLIEAIEAHGTVSAGACTMQLEKCNTGEAAGAGDPLLAAAFDMTSTINTPVTSAALATGVEDFIDGDELRLKLASGTITGVADSVITAVFVWK